MFSEFEFALKNLLLCFAEMGHRTTSLGSSVGSKQGPRSLSAVERLGESETTFSPCCSANYCWKLNFSANIFRTQGHVFS